MVINSYMLLHYNYHQPLLAAIGVKTGGFVLEVVL